MKKILVITSSHDSIVDYIVAIYSQKCLFFRLDLDRLHDYNFQLNQYGWSIDNYRELVTDRSVDAIYYRKPEFPYFRKYDRWFQDLMKRDIDAIIKGITNSFAGKCLNKPYITEIAENNVYQMYLAHKVGFLIPESLITNSPRCMDKFCSGIRRILKPLLVDKVSFSSYEGSSRNNIIEYTKPFEGLEVSPAYLQRFIKKDYDVIATFICEKSYVVRIDVENKENIKAKKNNIKCSSMVLPKEIEEKCLAFMKEVNLEFGAFKFILKNGEYYFLEMNTNFQWLWLENEFGWDLSAEIVEYLCS